MCQESQSNANYPIRGDRKVVTILHCIHLKFWSVTSVLLILYLHFFTLLELNRILYFMLFLFFHLLLSQFPVHVLPLLFLLFSSLTFHSTLLLFSLCQNWKVLKSPNDFKFEHRFQPLIDSALRRCFQCLSVDPVPFVFSIRMQKQINTLLNRNCNLILISCGVYKSNVVHVFQHHLQLSSFSWLQLVPVSATGQWAVNNSKHGVDSWQWLICIMFANCLHKIYMFVIWSGTYVTL